jgi:hypothetical protein
MAIREALHKSHVGTSVYNGFVVWLIERKHRPELKGSAPYQMGALLCSAFTTLFSLNGKMDFFFFGHFSPP